jgi:predicted nuclease of predicted toxin-antitoxin system
LILLLDQGLPRSTVQFLRDSGISAQHTGDIGLAKATDETILNHAREQGQVVVTLDADFHTRLVLSGAAGPSVIRIRLEGLGGQELASLLTTVLGRCGEDLNSGAMVVVAESGIRIRRLPLVRL